ncbi:MAG: hypothetical protein M1348_01490 [Candidatus Parvarchaeota archaeon]|nr:hypothetical protein [Candidatus Parvarchaeota archaeon]
MEYKKTRNDLLKLRRLRVLVDYGETVLKKKMVLLTTIILSDLLNYRKNLELDKEVVKSTMDQIDFALSFDGVQSILSASNMITANYSLDFKKDNLIGTVVPSFILKNMFIKRGYGKFTTSFRVSNSSEKFGKLIAELIEDANAYLRIKKLAEGTYKTKVVYNSINKKLIPSLDGQQKAISEFLDSSERDENFNVRELAEENY